MLLNIDKPNGTATLHEEGCSMVPKPLGTTFKPLDKLGRDGGWFSVPSETKARDIAQGKLPGATFVCCQFCQ